MQFGNAEPKAAIQHQASVSSHQSRAITRQSALKFAAVLLAAAILYLCLFSRLGVLGFVGPDEPRYAWVARSMTETGDWVTPRLYGSPWFEKPILYYWLVAAAFRLFGISEFAARLPSALAALMAAIALAYAAWRFYGARTAWAVLMIFPTCIGVFAFARAATPDMLFAAALAVAMVLALSVVFTPPALPSASPAYANHLRTLRLVRFGIWLGLAALAKGPAAIALAGGSVLLWAVATGNWRRALRLAHPVVLISFCLVALPWYMLCALRNPDFLSEFLFRHNLERYLTPVFQHVQPWWFFGPVLLLGLVPWAALLAGAAREAITRTTSRALKDSPGFFLASWAIFPVLFFSFSQSKLPGYILPAFAPLALLLARRLILASKQRGLFSRAMLAALGSTWIILAVFAGYWFRRLPAEWLAANRHEISVWLSVTIAVGLAIAALAAWQKPAVLIATTLWTTVLVSEINYRLLPQLDPYLSSRAAARTLATIPGSQSCAEIAVYRVKRDWRYGLSFYLHQELREWPGNRAPIGSACIYTTRPALPELLHPGSTAAIVEQVTPETILVRLKD